MKISIITVVYNGVEYIESALQSVLEQTLPHNVDLEYIVIDGASTDGTVAIIEKYKKKITYFISESDKGIYDAMNKGIKEATGDIIGLLNSDDFYTNKKILLNIIETFKSNQFIDVVYGDLLYIDAVKNNKVVRYWKSKEYVSGLFKKGWHPAHPTLFVRNKIYKKYGYFDTRFKIAADYDFMLRIFEVHKVRSKYIPKVLVKMRIGGESNADIKNILQANIESYKAWRKNNFCVCIAMYATLRKPLSKLIQLLKRA